MLKHIDKPGEHVANEDDPIGSWIEDTDSDFDELKEWLIGRAASVGLTPLPWTLARHYLALAGVLPELPNEVTIQSAELLYVIERFPSPLDLRTRTCTFLQIVSTENDIDEARLSQLRLMCAPEVGTGYCEDGDLRHLALSFVVRPAVSSPVHQLLETDWKVARDQLVAAQRKAQEIFGNARLATRSYWERTYTVLFPVKTGK